MEHKVEESEINSLRSQRLEEKTAEEIEKSIRKKFHKQLFSRFAKAVRDYQLIQERDRIAVCISGGKDSTVLLRLCSRRDTGRPKEIYR